MGCALPSFHQSRSGEKKRADTKAGDLGARLVLARNPREVALVHRDDFVHVPLHRRDDDEVRLLHVFDGEVRTHGEQTVVDPRFFGEPYGLHHEERLNASGGKKLECLR